MKNLVLHRICKAVAFVVLIILVFNCRKKPDDTIKKVPEVETVSISDITNSSAHSGGIIILDQGDTIIAKGTCWSQDPNTSLDDSMTRDGSGSGPFSSVMEGLKGGTVYYFRAYAINSAGTGFGKILTFTTLPVDLPVLTTDSEENITSVSVVCGGKITSTGGGDIIDKGICYSKQINPNANYTSIFSGPGRFDI